MGHKHGAEAAISVDANFPEVIAVKEPEGGDDFNIIGKSVRVFSAQEQPCIELVILGEVGGKSYGRRVDGNRAQLIHHKVGFPCGVNAAGFVIELHKCVAEQAVPAVWSSRAVAKPHTVIEVRLSVRKKPALAEPVMLQGEGVLVDTMAVQMHPLSTVGLARRIAAMETCHPYGLGGCDFELMTSLKGNRVGTCSLADHNQQQCGRENLGNVRGHH